MTLIRELARAYPRQSATDALWERAGGEVAAVPEYADALVRWQEVWRKCELGAAVTPERLLRTVAEDLPRNAVVLAAMAERAHPDHVARAEALVARLEQEDPDDIDLGEWLIEDPDGGFAALAPALEGRIAESRRSELRKMIEDASVQGAIKATVSATVKTAWSLVLAALTATSGGA
jgi:hypothetical protein